ncbi:MAG: glycosyltransferase family 39 protein [Flavobacteriales bacterium]|nr:glycosyltransferase family 39 protein [Flavobacteriales bacterium]
MSTRAFTLTLLGLLVVVIVGSLIDVMEVDAAQYASMSRDMLQQDDWLQLFHRGDPYLDKPPMLFWLSALSFKLFGVHNWSYKLPSILFAFLGIFATYRFAALHYGREVARLAAVMFGASAAFLIMTNDVRCDTILTGSVITAIWMGSAWMEQRRWWQLIGCAFAIAVGMLAKGPMGLVAPVLALGGEVIFKRRWRILLDPRLWLIPLIVGTALVPMCIGLYEQHGMHGIRFYFWEQSFGRITGENRWKDDSSMLFFTHEVLWQMLPWVLFVLLGIWGAVKALRQRDPLAEYASITGAILVFVALSLSQFKLPHYLYVITPLFAVLGAAAWKASSRLIFLHMQIGVTILLGGLTVFLAAYCFPVGGWPFIVLMLALIGIVVFISRKSVPKDRVLHLTIATWLVSAFILNAHLYPQLMHYQANAQAGKWAKEQGLAPDHFFGMQVSGTALDFYAGHPVRWLSDAGEARPVIGPGVVIYTDRERYKELIAADLVPKEVIEFPDYSVQMLDLDLILPYSRASAIRSRFLLRY